MRNWTRRAALLLCTVAATVFYMILPPATTTVSARRCQQECDTMQSACFAQCSQQYEEGSESYNNCTSTCDQHWTSCSMSAITCEPTTPCSTTCYGCQLECTHLTPAGCVEFAYNCDIDPNSAQCACW